MNYMEITLPNYSYVFNFEEEFKHQDTRVWMIKNWTNSFYFCGVYMILIFGGQYYMQNRPKYELRRVMSIWNTALAAFSITGACRTGPEFFHVLRNYGFTYSVCVPSFIEQDRVSGFWTWMFALSKLPELGDTVFIVLRKQPLIFLHWYHHMTVLIYTWYSYTEYTSSARWFIFMNYCVHSLMYSYYALRSMGYSTPRSLAMVITLCQLAQMVTGCVVNIWARQVVQAGLQECHVSPTNIKLSLIMYFSYFVLFARFFQTVYFRNGKKAKGGRVNGMSSVHDGSSRLKAD